MKNIDSAIVEKYFSGRCTEEEVKQVLEWFDSPEGKEYLENVLDNDLKQAMDTDHNIWGVKEKPDSEKVLSNIYLSIENSDHKNSNQSFGSELSNIGTQDINVKDKKKKKYQSSFLQVAATILILFFASLFYFVVIDKSTVVMPEADSSHFATSENQQKQVRLGSGTVIHLNSRSNIWISANEITNAWEVELDGEAYFEVENVQDTPFTIHANDAKIEVLGTAFNVKSYRHENDVQVAVVEGSVSFSSDIPNMESSEVVLEEGHYAFLDLESNLINVEDFGVENYLVWMKGRLVFEDQSLDRVCLQLNRLYQIECNFEKKSFRDLQLTADFSDISLENTLSVIALSLYLDYRIENNRVVWDAESNGHE